MAHQKSADQADIRDALSSADVSLFGFKGWIGPGAGEDADPLHFGGGWPDQGARYVQEAIEYISAKNNSDDDMPFFLVLSIVNPHDVLAYPNAVDYGYVEETGQVVNWRCPPQWMRICAAITSPAHSGNWPYR